MILVPATNAHVSELLSWVRCSAHLRAWAGPNMRYPADIDTLTEDLQLVQKSSFSLLTKDQELLAFGQHYLRLGHCHLCRLIVSPGQRGKGVVQKLVELISTQGKREFAVRSCSLFVYIDNSFAIKAYLKAGFIRQDYPSPDSIADCLYMVNS